MAGTDRAALLAAIADKFIANDCRGLPFPHDGMRALRAEEYPHPPGTPYELRFSASWPDITIVCSRPLPVRLGDAFAGGVF